MNPFYMTGFFLIALVNIRKLLIFLKFSGGVERDQWHEIGKVKVCCSNKYPRESQKQKPKNVFVVKKEKVVPQIFAAPISTKSAVYQIRHFFQKL